MQTLTYKETAVYFFALNCSCCRGPYTKKRAGQLGQVQRRMLMGLVQIKACDYVTAGKFFKLRNSGVTTSQKEMGKWSLRWAFRMVSWDEHLRRERQSWCWSAQFLNVRCPEELEACRLEFGQVTTRAIPGCLCTRWMESIEFAKQWIF